MVAHDNLVAVAVNVTLLQWDGFGENIEASSHKIDIEHRVVPDHAENAFIKVSDLWRIKCNDDPSERKRFHRPFGLREAEQIILVSDKLESRGHVVVVLHVDQSVGRGGLSNLTKMNRIC